MFSALMDLVDEVFGSTSHEADNGLGTDSSRNDDWSYVSDEGPSWTDGFGTCAGEFQVPSEAQEYHNTCSDLVGVSYPDEHRTDAFETFTDNWNTWDS